MLDSAASTYVAALDFGRAVETFAQQQKYEAAIDAVKTYDSLVKVRLVFFIIVQYS